MEDTLSVIVGGATISLPFWATRTNFEESISISPRAKVPQLESSSAHPHAWLTRQGSPLANASLTTSPHVSLWSLGKTRQSAATYACDISVWFKKPVKEAGGSGHSPLLPRLRGYEGCPSISHTTWHPRRSSSPNTPEPTNKRCSLETALLSIKVRAAATRSSARFLSM